jgi:hypothetical protein
MPDDRMVGSWQAAQAQQRAPDAVIDPRFLGCYVHDPAAEE